MKSSSHVTYQQRQNSSLYDYAAGVTDLEPFGPAWLRGKCPLPGCTDEEGSFTLFPCDGETMFDCPICQRQGDERDFRRLLDGGEVVSIYSRHTDGVFGENKPGLPIKTVEEVLEDPSQPAPYQQKESEQHYQRYYHQ
jgi:hypothetical protein